jgi:hypothetical protein
VYNCASQNFFFITVIAVVIIIKDQVPWYGLMSAFVASAQNHHLLVGNREFEIKFLNAAFKKHGF